MIRSIAALSVIAMLAACGQKTETSSAAATPTAEATADACASATGDGIVISDAWVRAAGEGQATSAVYLTICNAGADADTLVGAASDAAETVELHQTSKNADGVMTMSPVDGLALDPKKSAVLAPGGSHIMLIGFKGPINPGDKVEVTLEFANRAPMPITVEARGMHDGGHGH